MYEHVLVPTDGSEPADRAVDQAVELAARFDATLHALFVVDVDERTPLSISSEPVVEGLRTEGEKITQEAVDRAPDDLETVTAVEQGEADETILAYAGDHDVDAIVMGTHGRRGLDRFLLGSVTESVLRNADCSVLVSRSTGPRDE
ncbi:universal stress protein [Natrialbaceae archaeon AArc-T1-2]|uniref:universal stress protein n=1 Tax=Natrialbaceae archaeon AArc-T1-2 TaxID=3053904 RepID=UPI00255AE3F9|nr:universal stress protein [Natrialbaceae archaeon AArc-T1-2]WIV68327.1 universal stress protein [Natrialbaceae archaeon AArc-T1-2]